MEDFFTKENAENLSFNSYLTEIGGASSRKDFNIAKNNYVSQMEQLKNKEESVSLKEQIGRYEKEARNHTYMPRAASSSSIHISGNVVNSNIGSSSSVININNNNKRATQAPREREQRTTDDMDIFYDVNSAQDIWNLWYRFFKECKADNSMHEFSLEKVGIIQHGYKVKMRSCLIPELYEHLTPKRPILTNPFNNYEEDIVNVFTSENEITFAANLKLFKDKLSDDKNALFIAKITKQMIEVPINPLKQQWIKESEANYSYYFVWKLFDIVTKFSNIDSLCFQVGEYKLKAIKNEIVRRGDETLNSCSYNADGCHTAVVGGKTVELSLLEVTGAFGLSDLSRATKDHVKGGFGALALLQEVGHIFEFGSLGTFQSIRVYFVQALEKQLRLWSIEQVSQGVCVMELVETAIIPTTFEDNEISIRDVVNLLWIYKHGLERSWTQIKQLEREHKEVKLSVARKLVNPASVVSLVRSLEKGVTLKIKGEYIPGYHELEVMTS